MKRRNFLKGAGAVAVISAVPLSVLASENATAEQKKEAVKKFAAHDIEQYLQDNPNYKLLNKYARVFSYERGEFIERRNKAWLTGSYDRDTDESTMQIHFLFESSGRGLYFDVDTESAKVLDGIIIRDSYVYDHTRDTEEQVNEAYNRFFDYVMMSHFGNNNPLK